MELQSDNLSNGSCSPQRWKQSGAVGVKKILIFAIPEWWSLFALAVGYALVLDIEDRYIFNE